MRRGAVAVMATVGMVVALAGPAGADEPAQDTLAALDQVGVLDESVDAGQINVSPGAVQVPEQAVTIESAVIAGGAAVDRAGTVVVEDTMPSTDGVVQEIPGGVRLLSIAKGPDAPTAVEYTFAGSELIEGEGGTVLVHVDGTPTAIVAPAWATDAAGRAVPTRYEIDGDTLIQVTEHQGYAYPVVSDPASIGFCMLNFLPAVCTKYTRSETVRAYNQLTAAGSTMAVVVASCNYLKRWGGSPVVTACRAVLGARAADYFRAVATAYAKGSAWCVDLRFSFPIVPGAVVKYGSVRC